MDRMKHFYTRRLGFKLERDFIADRKTMKEIFNINSPCRMQYLFLGDFKVELFRFLDVRIKKRDNRTAGLDHWTILVKDKVKFCNSLKKKNIQVIRITKPYGFTFFIKDPESNLIEVKSYND